jgi:uncharacterized ferritin-like protein (DUF455 family)
MMPTTLCAAALAVLNTADASEKARASQRFVSLWRSGEMPAIGSADIMPDRPARPAKPELLNPGKMPKRRKAGSAAGKIPLLHALAHIELNAIDLAWDIIARFAYYSDQNAKDGFTLPRAFFDDWCKVADDEAKHFLMLENRLRELGSFYGALPAHDGLWESAMLTAHDFAARLAVVPMVLEARGLDVTPAMAESMRAAGDDITAALLKIIHDDEITHVRAGTDWFAHWCTYHGLHQETHWQELVRGYFSGRLRRPFNHPSREQAGMIRDWYELLADEGEAAVSV